MISHMKKPLGIHDAFSLLEMLLKQYRPCRSKNCLFRWRLTIVFRVGELFTSDQWDVDGDDTSTIEISKQSLCQGNGIFGIQDADSVDRIV